MSLPETRSGDTDAVNPFKPPQFKHAFTFKLFSTFLFLIRFPFMIIMLGVISGYIMILSLLPSGKTKHALMKLASFLLYKVVVFFTGTFSVNIQPTPLVDRYSDVAPFIKPKAGDLIISNFGSFMNILFLQGNFAPIFVVPLDDTHVLKKSFVILLVDIFACRDLRRHGVKTTLNEVLEIGKNKLFSPVCIFPEAAPGNGQALLKFQKFGIGSELTDVGVSIIGFLNSNIGVSSDLVIGTGAFWHIVQMFGRLCGTVKVRTALPQDVPRVPDNGISEKWISDCRTIMALIMRIPESVYSADDYAVYIPKRRKGHAHTD